MDITLEGMDDDLGEFRFTPSEVLLSMPKDKQIAELESYLNLHKNVAAATDDIKLMLSAIRRYIENLKGR